MHVEYHEKTGFAFSSNLTHFVQKQHTGFKNEQPQFVYEGPIDCVDYIFFNSNLNWYGVYQVSKSKYQRKRVTPIFEPYYSPEKGFTHRIKTNDSINAEFLIGLPYELSDTTIYRSTIPTINYGNHKNQGLLPGMSIVVGYNANITYSIDVLGTVDSTAFVNYRSNTRPIIRDYQLRLTSNNGDELFFQNLNKEVDIGRGQNLIEIIFAGDLNSDGVPDFIIKTRDGDVSEYLLHLLMSGPVIGKLVERVTENYWGGCM